MEDFRNYEREGFDLDAGLNLIVGSNAQGKTNVLEAVSCLSGLGSPRSSDAALVREGAARALIHADVARGVREVQIDLEIVPGRGTRALINKTPVPAARVLGETVVSVFFGPDELSLVKGSPDGRRRFLDEVVVKRRPAREGLRREWERVLRQRNALLKSAPRGAGSSVLATLEVWDEALCRAGAALAAARLEVLTALTPFALRRFQAIAGGGQLELTLQSSWLPSELSSEPQAAAPTVDVKVLEGALEKALDAVRARELERGMSLVGPQRDDVGVTLTSSAKAGARLLDARSHASQGEQRTAALALKLGEYDLLCEALREEPILLLDDVYSELDPARRAWLSDAVRTAGQVIVSSAEPGAATAAGAGKVVEVTAGRVIDRG